ncbi:acyltransferase [Salinimicrobium sp. TIG7-5_MAKvit]|uniref:acyltransferase n=1 Tax=Salinimicrobium sp. TIG7-5_MAKvit TaxID=3121289 RepID=UPI003C6DD6FD
MSKVSRIPKVIYLKIKITIKFCLFKIAKNWVVLDRLSRRLRPAIWRWTGCNIGDNVSIGYDVYYDVHNAPYITIEDDVWVAAQCTLFCHKRDLTNYQKGDRYNDLSYKKLPVLLKKGCVVGIGTMVLPGVTIGEGAIIGAGSLVIKDIPAWTIAVGNPAKVVRHLKDKGTP